MGIQRFSRARWVEQPFGSQVTGNEEFGRVLWMMSEKGWRDCFVVEWGAGDTIIMQYREWSRPEGERRLMGLCL
jgi:hypothetical protein